MLPLDLLLALRYLRPKRTFVSAITLLSILGPVLGVAILLIVNAIMTGFDRDIRTSIMNMQAHIQVYPLRDDYFRDPGPVMEALERHPVQAAPVIESTALIQIRDQILPKYVRGIDPEREKRVTTLLDSTDMGGNPVLDDGQVLIGDMLGQQTGLRPGSQFLIHSPARLTQNIRWQENGRVEIKEPDELYLPEEVTVAGYFSMGVSDYDANIIVMSLDQAAELTGREWGSATSIQLRVPDPMNMNSLVAELREKFPDYVFVTWQERNQMLFGTLRVEKNLMTFLMAFIVLVASFTIASTLITVVVQKTREIGILKAVGTPSGTIARIFLIQGGLIGLIGTAGGTALGLLVIALRDQIANVLSLLMGHDVFPAELYHLTRIPAQVTAGDLCLTLVMSITICLLAALVPALFASSLQPAKSLQEDS